MKCGYVRRKMYVGCKNDHTSISLIKLDEYSKTKTARKDFVLTDKRKSLNVYRNL